MDPDKRSHFGLSDYEKFREIFMTLYQEIKFSKNLKEQLKEIEEGLIILNARKEVEAGHDNFYLNEVIDDLLYLKQLILDRMDYFKGN